MRILRRVEMSWPEDTITNIYGTGFFSRSPFRSGFFLIATSVFMVAMLGSAAFFFFYWNRVRFELMVVVLLVVCSRAVNCMWAAIQRHQKLRSVYFVGKSSDQSESIPAKDALDVAARAILDDLFYTSCTLLLFLFLLVMSLPQRR